MSGADDKCQALAIASSLTRGGTYKAWLSLPAESPTTRFTSINEPGDYELVTGVTVATSWATLTDGSIEIRIDVNEAGVAVSDVLLVLTKTETNGEFWTSGSTCGDWDSTQGITAGGDSRASNAFWSEGFLNLPCANEFRLYCFEQK